MTVMKARLTRFAFVVGVWFVTTGAGLFGGVCGQPVRVLSPQPEEIVAGPDVWVHVAVEGLDVRPGCYSIHIMLDNEPFAVQYDVSRPYRLHDVVPGTHTLRVYAANAFHEIVPGTLVVVPFAVQYHDGENRPERGEPLLTYVLPQGEYRGIDGADILVNFEVSGVRLSHKGYRVQYYVDGQRRILTKEGSAHLRDLGPGYHRIRMELVDEKGRIVPGPFNVVERMILVSPTKDLEPVRFGRSPALSSIQGPMTGGQLWVGAGQDVLAAMENASQRREVGGSKRSRRPSTRSELRRMVGRGEISVVKPPAVEEELERVGPAPSEHTPASSASEETSDSAGAGQRMRSTESVPSKGEPANNPPGTTSPLRTKRISIGRAAAQIPTTATLRAVAVTSTRTQVVRLGDARESLTSPPSAMKIGGKLAAPQPTAIRKSPAPSPPKPTLGAVATATPPPVNRATPAPPAMPESRATSSTESAGLGKIERVIGSPQANSFAVIETEADREDGESTGVIARVLGATTNAALATFDH